MVPDSSSNWEAVARRVTTQARAEAPPEDTSPQAALALTILIAAGAVLIVGAMVIAGGL